MRDAAKKTLILILTFLAKQALKKYRPTIIAIAGSVGKTSTKDAIYSVLSSAFSVRKSEKSYNGDLGVPLTILGLPNVWGNGVLWLANIARAIELVLFRERYPKYLVLEMGADAPGDIERIVKWVKPDISVLTRFGDVPVHVEFFHSRKELIEEDGYIVKELKKGGLLVVNEDDADSLAFKLKTTAKSKTFGFTQSASIIASQVQVVYGEGKAPTGIIYRVDMGGATAPLRVPGVIGRAQVYASLPALLIGDYLGINLVSGGEALEKHVPPPGRLKLIPGLKGATVVDDTYNSSPVASEQALEGLKLVEVGKKAKKIVVLGDMLELGRNSSDEHHRIGALAGAIADVVVTVGIRARRIAEGALDAGLTEKNIFQFEEAREAGKFVEGIMTKGDVILVKGSQSMRMERIVEEIMVNPEDAPRLLVRQDAEWKKR